MRPALLIALAFLIGCEDREGARVLAASLSRIQGIKVIEVSAQQDELLPGRLFDAVIEAEGHSLFFGGLDPANARSGAPERLMLISIDGLYPTCARRVGGEFIGGVDLRSDPRVVDLAIRRMGDLATKASLLYERLAALPRSEDAAVEYEFHDGSRRCWVYEKTEPALG